MTTQYAPHELRVQKFSNAEGYRASGGRAVSCQGHEVAGWWADYG